MTYKTRFLPNQCYLTNIPKMFSFEDLDNYNLNTKTHIQRQFFTILGYFHVIFIQSFTLSWPVQSLAFFFHVAALHHPILS